MATPSEARAVKSLNNSDEIGRRFVFKKFVERIAEVNIDVYRSLHPLKAEPSEGSTFFRDCLVEYRELNTAEDFISFYEETLPLVQTLPQIILQKEKIVSSLLDRLKMEGRLSHTPILRLLAALARDLLEDFIPFLQTVSGSLLCLLECGADKDPEIVEEIFTSWSYIMMYLQKYLVKDIGHVLRVTAKIRYYSRDYVREFMANSVSFIFRKAPIQQLKKGIRKLMLEVIDEPSDITKSGAAALLSHAVRITSSTLHSNAETLIPLLLDESSFDFSDQLEGPAVVLDVLILSFQQLYEKLDPSGCKSIGNHICLKITNCVTSENSAHLIRLLTLLIATLESDHRVNVSDHQNVVELVGLLVQNFVVHYVDQHSDVINKVLQLMLCILDGRSNSRNTSFLAGVSSHWGLVFDLRTRSLLDFIEDLLKKDLCVFNVFETNIMCALNNFIDIYEEDVVHLMLLVYEKLDGKRNQFVGENCKDLQRLHSFTEETLCYWIGMINKAIRGGFCVTEFKHDKLAILWGVIRCYPHFADAQNNQSLLMDLINAVDELLMVKSKFAAFSEDTWYCLIGAALRSHHKLVFSRKTTHDESAMTRFLDLAKRYKSSPHVLSAVAGILDLTYGDEIEANATCQFYIPQHVTGLVLEALDTFMENLSHANKEIRLSTLRILCHYEPLGNEIPVNDLPVEKKKNNVLYLLRSIEATPISVTSCHVSLISKMEMSLNARRVPEQYMPIVLSGIIGIFHNRFRNLWDPALKCLDVIFCQYSKVLWARFVQYLDHFQSIFLTSLGQCGGNDADDFNNTGLLKRFNSDVFPSFDSTPIAMVFSLLIQSLQKVPSVADSHSRQVVPLFLKFLGYNVDEQQSAQHHTAEPKGKEWKSILRDWLNLFRLLQNPKAFYKSQFFKDVLLYRLLDENDADLQMTVLDCLLNWKDDFLIPYRDHLKNLISTEYLRDEITRWSLSSNSMNAIDVRHRCDVVPIVIRVLIPKVRNMKMLGSQKNGGNHRKAVLGFLSQLDVHELPLFFALLTKPLLPSSQGDDEVWQNLWESRSDASSNVLKHFTVGTIKSLSCKKVCGFLHVIEDILAVFDETRLQPFLNLLAICIVRILASCTSSLETASNEPSSSLDNSTVLDANVGENEKEAEDQITERMDVKQSKDLRSLCLRIVYRVISKYEENDFGDDFWLLFFTSVKPLIQRFKQEGASSEKPSSLFHCFLAMSKSHKLVPLLFMERNLVPDIFSILTVPSASESILSCVLKFAKNLLKLDSELGSEVNSVKELLVPHLNVLMCSLHSIFTKGNATKRKLIKSPGKKEFTIFKLLSNYVKEPSEANIFIDMLLPLLTKRTLHPDICVEVLQLIQQLVALTGKESSKIILKSVTPLLISAGTGVRTIICDVLDTLAAKDTSLVIVAQILGELNAIAEMEIDDLDYDKVICAYNKINVELFYSIAEEQALVILSHCIYDMSSKVLRQCALGVLRSFIEFSGMILDGSLKSGHVWSESNIQHVVKNFLLKHMGDAMDKEPPVLQVWFELLKDMVLKIPNVANLGSYRPLCSDDPEQDFFINLFHLQKHLRARALLRFKNVMGSGEQSEVVSNKVFVPLLFRLLFELQDGKDEHIRSACMQALSFLSSNMNWNQYYALLNRCFRDLKLKADKQKILLRLICSILDHYHFSEASTDNKSSTHEEHDPYFIDVASSSTLHHNGNSVELSIIQTRLQKNVLPKIQNMFASDPDKINVYASIVALKVLKLLPADIMDSQLPTIVHRISNFLKNRLESVRDEARHALAACLKELGLEYLQFVVKVLRSTLKRGYELHVLGHTLNFILLKFLTSPICGKLDYCLEDLLAVVENDILGGVSDEKDVDKIASKMKETRKQKSFETLKVIAQSVSFKTHGLKLLSIVTNNLSKQLNQKVKSKIENMLTNIAAGIESNPSVDRTELFVFVYGLIADGSSDEVDEHALKNDEAPSNRLLNVDRRYSHLITTFSLGVMHNYMKKMKLNKEDEQLLSLLDPFVKRLCQCLSSKYESVITGALRCLCLIITLPLPSLQSQADSLKDSLLIITQGSINSNQLTESCVKLLTTLLRSTRVTLSSDQLHMLIQFPLFVDLAKNPSGIALSLLKAIVHRKLVVPEIYDIVQIVAELMVQSQVEQFRKKCSKIFLQFLLGYHISEKRLQQHLDMLLANLRYEHSTGRESVLEMLHAIIKKFPRNIVDAHSQTMFVHLVVSLANDEDTKVRSMTIVALKCLISHVNVNSLHSILEYCQLWYFGKKQNLWGAAAQVLGLLVEVMGKGFTKHLKSVLQAMRSILQSAASAFRPGQQNLSDEVVVPLWKEAYYSLVMFEKILNQFNNLFFDKDLEDIWEIICQFLLHPRSWLRNISNSLLSQYYSSVTNACRENQEQSLQNFMLMKPSKLFLVSVSLCCQLKVPLIEEAVQTLLSQNLVFAICSLHSVLEKREISDAAAFWSALEPAEQDVFVKAFVVLDPKKGRRALAYRNSEQGHHVQRHHPFVTYMLQRMGKMCFEMEASQMKVVFDCLKMISPRLLHSSTTLSPVADRDPNSYAYQILLPLYRVQEGYTGSVVTDDVKQVAQKVSESIRDIIGVPNFVQIYHDLSKNLKQKRDKRKQEVQIMAVVNPERNAKRKLRIAAKHSANKKRKITSMKIGRWMR